MRTVGFLLSHGNNSASLLETGVEGKRIGSQNVMLSGMIIGNSVPGDDRY